MIWFGRKKKEEPEPVQTAECPQVEVLLTEVTVDQVTLRSRRPQPLGVWLYLNATAPTIENVRSTGLKIRLDEARKVGRTTQEYRGTLDKTTPALIEWLQQVRDQGLPNAKNAPSYVSLHLDQRVERRAYRQFQVMSPDIPSYKGLTSDISSTGMRLQVPGELAIGATVRLQLVFDDFNFDDVKVTGEVLWTLMRDPNSWWVGIRFVDLSEQAREAIVGYIGFVEGYKKKRFRGA